MRKRILGEQGIGCPLVALALQWRRHYPNKLPPKLAAVASEMGHEPPPALQNCRAAECDRREPLGWSFAFFPARCRQCTFPAVGRR
jgi:hypothetical protein